MTGLKRGDRLGPRPLAMHLSVEMTSWMTARSGLPLARFGILPWRGMSREEDKALTKRLQAVDLEKLSEAVDREAWKRFRDVSDGVARYQDHDYQRDVEDPPAIWSRGAARLLDYSACAEARGDGALGPILIVPSLVNRAYILDLNSKKSFLRHLAGLGYRPLLMDWGRPGEEEAGFGLDDYICDLLGEALDLATEMTGAAVPVIGYCMGGVLALGLTALRSDQVSSLVLLATPWDFHADDPTQFEVAAAFSPMLPSVLQTWGELPVDALQALFASLDVFGTGRKFRGFNRLSGDSDKAASFVALEDWVNDGVPLVKRVAVEVLSGWYVRNLTGAGKWRVDGKRVDPAAIQTHSLVLVPSKDRIVPPKTALALGNQLPNATILSPDAGHIGMMVGSGAATKVWAPIAGWLQSQKNSSGET